MKYVSKLTLVFVFGTVGLFAQAPDTAWTRIFKSADYTFGNSVQETADRGYIVTGNTRTNLTYLIKVNSSGDSLWAKSFSFAGGPAQQTIDKGFIIGGAKNGNVYLLRIDSLGDSLWAKTYCLDSVVGAIAQQTFDGGYIIAGSFNPNGTDYSDSYLMKTDSSGDSLWVKTYGGNGYDGISSFQQTTDGGYIVAGTTESYGAGDFDVYLIKTDFIGDTLWTRTFGGEEYDDGFSVQQTFDGGYIAGGGVESYGSGDRNAYVIKIDSMGDTLWTKTFGETDQEDIALSVQQTDDKGYIIGIGAITIGWGYDDIYLIKTDSIGDTLWTGTYGTDSLDNVGCVRQTSDGGYVVAGYTDYNGNLDIYLIKLKPEGSGIEEEITTGLFTLFPADPNPFTSKTIVRYELANATNVNVSIYNMLGQKVRDLYSGRQSSGIHSVSWDGRGDSGEKLSSGIYFLKIKAGEKEASRKVTLVR